MAIELRRKGVADDVINGVLEAEYARVDEYRVARDLAEERHRRLAGETDPAVRTRRLVDYLTRRGFPRSLALDLTRALEKTDDG